MSKPLTLKPLKCTERVLNALAWRFWWPLYHYNGQTQSAGSGDLPVGRLPTRVLGHKNVNRIVLEKADFVLLFEGPAIQEKLRLRWQDSFIRPVDRADHIGMLWRCPESRELKSSDSQKDAARLRAERSGSGIDAIDVYPTIAAERHPARSHDRNKWKSKCSRCAGSILGDLAGERMRGIDNDVNALRTEPIDKSFNPAKATDTVRHGRQDRQSSTPCQRQYGREPFLARYELREFTCFRRAAENENAHVRP